MKKVINQFTSLVLLLGMLLLVCLSSCGQKGPLYLEKSAQTKKSY